MVPTTVQVKKAFSPIPGARPTGQLAYRPIRKQPRAAARHVATNAAPWSMPASAMMLGLTKMM